MNPAAVWESAQNALIAGDATTLDRLLRDHLPLFRGHQPPSYGSGGLAPDYSGGDAKSILVRAHHFENWDQFAEFLEALRRPGSPIAKFEAAVDAIVAGDSASLETLLRENPELVRARSPRRHHSTLLHYVAANGVEDFRQKTPPNIVPIAEILLAAGAEVDAEANIYGGGSRTLGLAVTSIHPLQAGVLEPLLQLLLKHGAAVDGSAGRSVVNDCLANGRLKGAQLMAAHGARVDLEGAAGIGRLDLVESLYKEATPTQISNGFNWACEYGHASVVDFLLRQGLDIGARGKPHGQTGLHWAAYCAHADIVKLLLDRNAPLDVKDESFDGTPLGWARHAQREASHDAARGRYAQVISLLAAAGAA